MLALTLRRGHFIVTGSTATEPFKKDLLERPAVGFRRADKGFHISRDGARLLVFLALAAVGMPAANAQTMEITSDGTQERPIISHWGGCTWNSNQQQEAATALCIASGFENGSYVSGENPCSYNVNDSTNWVYALLSGTSNQGQIVNEQTGVEARITAACTDCGVGKYANYGLAQCDAWCEQNGHNADTCDCGFCRRGRCSWSCDPNDERSVACPSAGAGGSAVDCISCEAGTYSSSASAASCISCDAGKYSATVVSTNTRLGVPLVRVLSNVQLGVAVLLRD
jgi:hypothetical protein